MIRKKDLLALSAMEIPTFDDVPKTDCPNAEYVCTAKVENVGEAPLLDLHIWALNVDIPIGLFARVFFDKKNKRFWAMVFGRRAFDSNSRAYIFNAMEAPKWSEASILTLIGLHTAYNHLDKHLTIATGPSESAIRKYFKRKEKSAIEMLEAYQEDLRRQKTEKQKRDKAAAVERVMKHVRELPDDWDSFVEDYVLLDSRYFLYERTKSKKIVGTCTKCHKTGSLEKARHNTRGICPSCGSPVWLKAKGISNWTRDEAHGYYIQPLPDGTLIIRLFEFWRSFRDKFNKSEQYSFEYRRYYVDQDGAIAMYDRYEKEWRRRSTLDYFHGKVYPGNVKTALAGTVYRYCAADVLAARGVRFGLIGWLTVYMENPFIEYLPKMGLYSLSEDISGAFYQYSSIFKLKEKDPHNIFPFSKDDIRMFSKLDMNGYEIQLYGAFAKKGYGITDEVLLELRNLRFPAFEVLGLSHDVDPLTAFRYFKKQKTGERSFETLISMWKDYVRMAAAAGYDMNDSYYLLPPDLVTMHDEVDALTRMQKMDENYRGIFLQLAKEYENLYYEGDKYIIRVPSCLEELVLEGMKLHICVANPNNGYIQAYCGKKKYLFVVRKANEPDKPFVTFEMHPNGTIGQVSGRRNLSPPAEVRQAINAWQKAVAMPIIGGKQKKTANKSTENERRAG